MSRKVNVIVCVVAVASLLLGVLIGYFSRSPESPSPTNTPRFSKEKLQNYHQELVDSIEAKKIEEFLRYFTERPHIAGSARNYELANYIGDKFTEYGFDSVEKPKYDVLLSKLPKGESNVVELFDKVNGDVKLKVEGQEPFAEPSENDTLVSPPFLAYSANGTVKGDLVYANYGTRDDFHKLKDTLGVDIRDKIVIMRFGKIYRGSKVQNAADFGANGVILYNDPADYAPLGVNETYTKTWFLPGTAAQRGTILNLDSGDPLTVGLPAIPSTFRIPVENATLPKTIAHTLHYNEAIKLLRLLKGKSAPAEWKGTLPGVPYNLGPGFQNANLQVRLTVKTQNIVQSIYNVIGTIEGHEEPDRYVLIGNHRDAWVFGAVDPSSGSATTLELARVFGKMLKNGWRPRRTIKFCSWGGEEYGNIGSYEWVEEHAKLISDRAVAYINIDIAVMGNYSFKSKGSPVLRDAVFRASKTVEDPNRYGNKKWVFDMWAERYPSSKKSTPAYGSVGGASDIAPFYLYVGVPGVDIRYGFSSEGVTYYPVYHTMHDSFNWMKTFADPSFFYHRTVGRVGARLLLDFADSPLLPFKFSYYGQKMLMSYLDLEKVHGVKFENQHISLQHLKSAIDDFISKVNDFDKKVSATKGWEIDAIKLRMLNDQMMQFERAFMEPAGLPGRQLIRHVIVSASKHDNYGVTSFAGVTDQLYEIDKNPENWMEVKRQVSFLTSAIRAASSGLKL